MLHNKISTKNQSGFTIVELLIVIVVIGILAAITIVSYSGITARANTSNAQTVADNVSKKADIYNTEPANTGYPSTLAALTGAASTTTYYMAGVSIVAAAMTAAPTAPSYVNFYKCGTGAATTAPTSNALITTTTGNQIGYWNYSTNAVVFDTAGITTGLVGTYNVACFISTT